MSLSFGVALMLASCSTGPPLPQVKSPKPEWSGETFPLPPPFAPSLPKGSETLRFPTGWRTPKSEAFWSYAFVMWIEEHTPKAERLRQLLTEYYDGLLATFATSAGKPLSKSPTRVEIKALGDGRFDAKMRTTDAFATFKPIDVNLKLETSANGKNRSLIKVRLSPKPSSHQIWKVLDRGLADIMAESFLNPALSPLAPFSKFTEGRWKTSFPDGSGLLDTWRWGPGNYSIRSNPKGTMPDGTAWNSFTVYFWDPAQRQVRLVGASPANRGVTEGTMEFDGQRAAGRFDIFQSVGKRPLALTWTFDGPDQYQDRLFDAPSEGDTLQNEWTRRRISTSSVKEAAIRPPTSRAPGPSGLVRPIEKIVGVHSSALSKMEFTHLPGTDAFLGRVLDSKSGRLVADIYLFHHTGRQELRWLSLSADERGGPAVSEGPIHLCPGGNGFRVAANELRNGKSVRVEHQFEFLSGNTVRHRTWTVNRDKRTLTQNTTFRRS